MKVILETWCIWWRSFQKGDVSDEGYSRNVTYLIKVIPETWRIWDTSRFLNDLHQIPHVSGLEYPSSNTSRFWNNLHQIRHVSGITFIRYVTYLMKVILETWCIWWRSFQKGDVSDEGYFRNVMYLMIRQFLEWPSSNTSRFWNNLHQIRHVSGITFIRYVTFLE
jgi:hypothetical protein